MKILLDNKFQLKSDIGIKEENDVFMIFKNGKQTPLMMNEIGWDILKNHNSTIEEIINRLKEKYHKIEYDTIKKDTLVFINECAEKGIVSIV